MTTSSFPYGINGLGTWTLYRRECWRFLKVWNQTVIAPVVTTLLFLAIFSLALGGSRSRIIEGLPYTEFIAPGLVMMAIVQNAFANASSSLMLAKIQGVIVDLLMPPLSPSEICFAMTMGGVTRGFMVGLAVYLAVLLFVPMPMVHPGYAVLYVFLASLMMSLLGILGGLWAQTFDQMAALTNYVITPLAFLSGTFYSVRQLPGIWHAVSHADPFFYMIDGFRYAVTGYHDGNLTLGIWYLMATNIVLWSLNVLLLRTGYRLKQ